MKKTLILTLSLLFAAVTAVSAQKFGFTNSVALLSQLPEVKAADSDLQAFQAQQQKLGQQMVKDLQDKAAELERKKEQGTISPKDYETQAIVLQQEEQKINEFAQKVEAELAKKREELFKPILDRVNQAMQDVAKEGGYLMVFDASTEVLLYADESLDVTKAVMAKLGIQ